MKKSLTEQLNGYAELSKKVRNSPELLAKFQSDPKGLLKENGIETGNASVVGYLNDDKTEYFVIPANNNQELSDEDLTRLNAAKSCTSTAGCAGSAGTISTFITSLGSASSVGTAGTGGCADTGRTKNQ